MKENKSPLPSFAKGDLKSSFTRGFALALGLTAGALLSVAVTGMGLMLIILPGMWGLV